MAQFNRSARSPSLPKSARTDSSDRPLRRPTNSSFTPAVPSSSNSLLSSPSPASCPASGVPLTVTFWITCAGGPSTKSISTATCATIPASVAVPRACNPLLPASKLSVPLVRSRPAAIPPRFNPLNRPLDNSRTSSNDTSLTSGSAVTTTRPSARPEGLRNVIGRRLNRFSRGWFSTPITSATGPARSIEMPAYCSRCASPLSVTRPPVTASPPRLPPDTSISIASADRNDSRAVAPTTGGTGRSQCTTNSRPSSDPLSAVTSPSDKSAAATTFRFRRKSCALPAVIFSVIHALAPEPTPSGHSTARSANATWSSRRASSPSIIPPCGVNVASPASTVWRPAPPGSASRSSASRVISRVPSIRATPPSTGMAPPPITSSPPNNSTRILPWRSTRSDPSSAVAVSAIGARTAASAANPGASRAKSAGTTLASAASTINPGATPAPPGAIGGSITFAVTASRLSSTCTSSAATPSTPPPASRDTSNSSFGACHTNPSASSCTASLVSRSCNRRNWLSSVARPPRSVPSGCPSASNNQPKSAEAVASATTPSRAPEKSTARLPSCRRTARTCAPCTNSPRGAIRPVTSARIDSDTRASGTWAISCPAAS